MSVCLHTKSLIVPAGFSWNFVFGICTKVCWLFRFLLKSDKKKTFWMKELEMRSFRLLRYKDKEYDLSKFTKSVEEIRRGDRRSIQLTTWRNGVGVMKYSRVTRTLGRVGQWRSQHTGSVARSGHTESVARSGHTGCVAHSGHTGSVAHSGHTGSVARNWHTGSVAHGVRMRNRSIEKLEFI